MDVEAFEKFANGLGSGFIKPWKANSMLGTLAVIDGLQKDAERREAWVRNCLIMEGFSELHCKMISNFLEK